MNDQIKWNESFVAGRDYNPLNEVLIDSVISSLSVKPKIAIDLGCGTGDGVVKLAKRDMQVTGFDWSPDALAKARSRAVDAGVANQVAFKELNLDNPTEAGLGQNSIDFVLCKLVIAFLKDKVDFCKYIKGVLAKNGVFVLITPVLYDGYKYNPEDKPGIAMRYEEILKILNSVFSDVKVFNHSYYNERGDLVTFIAS